MIDQKELINLIKKAGNAVMEVYGKSANNVRYKSDSSPVTIADEVSDKIIEQGIKMLSSLPIISEDGNHSINDAEDFWLVDPLDGTKEFIKHNGEFTINIALVKNSEPVLGIVYAPDKDLLYVGEKGQGAYKVVNGTQVKINADFKGEDLKIAVSRSHGEDELKQFDKFKPFGVVPMGSSLKLCLVADGQVAFYPRLGPTYGWDTAAADAIIRAAGGNTVDGSGMSLTYGEQPKKNPSFVAYTKEYASYFQGNWLN